MQDFTIRVNTSQHWYLSWTESGQKCINNRTLYRPQRSQWISQRGEKCNFDSVQILIDSFYLESGNFVLKDRPTPNDKICLQMINNNQFIWSYQRFAFHLVWRALSQKDNTQLFSSSIYTVVNHFSFAFNWNRHAKNICNSDQVGLYTILGTLVEVNWNSHP